MNAQRLTSLLDHYFDQSLAEAERAELQEMLSLSVSARGAFWEAARWHALLWQWGSSGEARHANPWAIWPHGISLPEGAQLT